MSILLVFLESVTEAVGDETAEVELESSTVSTSQATEVMLNKNKQVVWKF